MQEQKPVKQVKSAIRTMALFERFAESGRPLSLTEITALLNAPKSSCHELLQTLVQRGYVLVLDGGKYYYPSRRLLDLAQEINEFNPIKQKVNAQLRSLRDRTGETVVVGRLQGKRVVYADVFEGNHTIRYTARPGDLKHVHASALGKALLASIGEEQRDQLLTEIELARFTERTITDSARLRQNLADCARAGIYTTTGEGLIDVMGMALPIELHGHLLAIGLVGPIQRVEEHLADYAEAMSLTVEKITN